MKHDPLIALVHSLLIRAGLAATLANGVIKLTHEGQEHELAIRKWPTHPEGVIGYTDRVKCWCLDCSSPDDVVEYDLCGMWAADGWRGYECDNCGKTFGGGVAHDDD